MSRGRARVATARREPARRSKVTLRPATLADCRRVWLWRNDEATRRASFDSALIPYATHEEWFHRSLERSDRKLYVIQTSGRGVGVARLDIDGSAATVSIHLAPAWQGRGVGPSALAALESVAFGTLRLSRLLASIKPDNRASLSAFRKAGYEAREGDRAVSLVKAR